MSTELHVREHRFRRKPWLPLDRPAARRLVNPLLEFTRIEASGGLVLVAAAVIGLLWANSPWRSSYEALWSAQVVLEVGPVSLREDLQHVVNDALMTFFFLVVGLEIKSELVEGELREPRKAALPLLAALGGMVVPALIYLLIAGGGDAARGWGIPMATDIAVALAVLAFASGAVPDSVKIFLLTLAIVDDIGAILVIAVFYTSDLSLGWLLAAVAAFAGLLMLRVLRVWYGAAYALLGVALWLAMYETGVHPTLAGVLLGVLVPARPLVDSRFARDITQERLADHDLDVADARAIAFYVRGTVSSAERIKAALHPWTSYLILPVFALANAGIPLDGAAEVLTTPVALGVAAGLLLGKPLGIVAATLIAWRLGVGAFPTGMGPRHVVGVGLVAGIGFTVSLFITDLAFADEELVRAARIAVLTASVIAGLLGALGLRLTSRAEDRECVDAGSQGEAGGVPQRH